MEINLTIKGIKNNQIVELQLNDVDYDNYLLHQEWATDAVKMALDKLAPEDVSEPVVTSNYKPVTNPKGAMASQKQINFLHVLGYNGDCTNLSVTEANALIERLKTRK